MLVTGAGPGTPRYLTLSKLKARVRALTAASVGGRYPTLDRSQAEKLVMRGVPVNSNHTLLRVANRVLDRPGDLSVLKKLTTYVIDPTRRACLPVTSCGQYDG